MATFPQSWREPRQVVYVNGNCIWFQLKDDRTPRNAMNYVVVEAPSGASTTSPSPAETDHSASDNGELPRPRYVGLRRFDDAMEAYKVTAKKAEALLTPVDTNPKTKFGQLKPPLGLVPACALVYMAEALRDGSDKYGPQNWRTDPVSYSTYQNAALRHMMAAFEGEDVDPSSGVLHLAHAMTNLAILLDAGLCGKLIDDRPPGSPVADLIRSLTRPMSVAKKDTSE